MNELPENRLDEIAEEVFDLLDIEDLFEIFEDHDVTVKTGMNTRLQEILSCPEIYQTIELAMYLRACSSWSKNLPCWGPLLEETIELGLRRGDQVHEMLYGLIPREPT